MVRGNPEAGRPRPPKEEIKGPQAKEIPSDVAELDNPQAREDREVVDEIARRTPEQRPEEIGFDSANEVEKMRAMAQAIAKEKDIATADQLRAELKAYLSEGDDEVGPDTDPQAIKEAVQARMANALSKGNRGLKKTVLARTAEARAKRERVENSSLEKSNQADKEFRAKQDLFTDDDVLMRTKLPGEGLRMDNQALKEVVLGRAAEGQAELKESEQEVATRYSQVDRAGVSVDSDVETAVKKVENAAAMENILRKLQIEDVETMVGAIAEEKDVAKADQMRVKLKKYFADMDSRNMAPVRQRMSMSDVEAVPHDADSRFAVDEYVQKRLEKIKDDLAGSKLDMTTAETGTDESEFERRGRVTAQKKEARQSGDAAIRKAEAERAKKAKEEAARIYAEAPTELYDGKKEQDDQDQQKVA